MHDLLVISYFPPEIRRGEWRALQARRNHFVQEHYDACVGDPVKLARLAMETGFYARNNAFCQIVWRMRRAIEQLNLGGARD